MAINPACFDTIARETGRELNERELKELDTELEKRIGAARAADPSLSDAELQLKAAEKLGQDLKLAAIIEKRNAILNQRKRIQLDGYLKNTWADRPADGLQALLTGVQRSRTGARRSVALEQQSLNAKYTGGLVADIEKLGHTKLFASGSIDEDISRALWRMDDEAPDFAGLMPEAVEVARAVRKWQEVSRVDANKEGAYIGKQKGYITRQSHDLHKIRKAGFERWRDAILPKLDLAATVGSMPDADVAKFLKATYEGLASGVHLKAETRPKMTGFKGPSNIARKLSSERVLHFKSADDWMAYNREFGVGSLRESVFAGLRKSALSTGMMRLLGTNPGNMIDVIGRAALERIEGADAKRKLSDALKPRGAIDNRLRQVDGTVNIPVNADAARVSANVRAVESMAKLGGAVLSSLTDIPTHASEVRYQGRGMLSGMGEALSGLASGRASGERLQVLSSMGVVFDSMVGEITRRGSLDESMHAGVARGLQTFFKYNLLNWWTDSLRSAAGLGVSHFLAHESVKSFEQLSPELKRLFSLYDIDASRWNLIRNGEQTLADGRKHLTPDGIEDEKTAAALRNFYVDRVHTAVIEPDAETMSLMRQGTQAGTAYGELLRFIGQFKSFGVAFTQKVLGREVYGYGADSLGEALKNGQSLRGLANVILMTTLFGYGSMAVKDLLKGKTPRDPHDPKVWAAAMVQGGGLGIYGDFLLGQSDRFGGGLLSKVAGPVPGLIEDIDQIRAKVFQGEDVGATALRTLVNNTPFANLFYTRMALDYAILFEVQESMNPGYLRRMERRAEKENGQTYWLRPTDAVR
jgi:hypothetical protein